MSKIEDERKCYWDNNYFEYWKARVEETNASNTGVSLLVRNDSVTISDNVYGELFKVIGLKGGKILDVGCGWGRFFPMYAACGLSISGIDISSKMICEAKKLEIPAITELKECIAEDLPYNTGVFDLVCCLGVFDATFQEKALAEMLRVSKIDGRVILTGKNAGYHIDDKSAFEAEKGARHKREPNFFTDVPCLLEQLKKFGHEVPMRFFFSRRGDFSANKYLREIPERFYEYLLVIEKKTEINSFECFSYKNSFTAEVLQGETE